MKPFRQRECFVNARRALEKRRHEEALQRCATETASRASQKCPGSARVRTLAVSFHAKAEHLVSGFEVWRGRGPSHFGVSLPTLL